MAAERFPSFSDVRLSRRSGIVAIAGAVACIVALILIIFAPAEALRGWVGVSFFLGALPAGALMLVMMIRLIPGKWGPQLEVFTEASMLLVPLAALAALPLMLGITAIYSWTSEEMAGFRGVYLSVPFFVLRTILWFALQAALAFLLLRRRPWSTPVSCIGLIAMTLLGSCVAVDWLVSLDPEFHSSGFGLYALCIQMGIALDVILIATVVAGKLTLAPNTAGALLLTSELFWAYFAFMQYFIIWSNNLPPLVDWYQQRGVGVLYGVEIFIATAHLAPLFALFFAPVRRDPRWIARLAALTLFGKAVECGWIVLPDGLGLLTFVLGTAGGAALFGALLDPAGGWRVRRRAPVREAAP